MRKIQSVLVALVLCSWTAVPGAVAEEKQSATAKQCCKMRSCCKRNKKGEAGCCCRDGKKCAAQNPKGKTSLGLPIDPLKFAGILDRLGWTDQVNRSMVSEPPVLVRPQF